MHAPLSRPHIDDQFKRRRNQTDNHFENHVEIQMIRESRNQEVVAIHAEKDLSYI